MVQIFREKISVTTCSSSLNSGSLLPVQDEWAAFFQNGAAFWSKPAFLLVQDKTREDARGAFYAIARLDKHKARLSADFGPQGVQRHISKPGVGQ